MCHQNGGQWIASGAKILLPNDVRDQLRKGEELGEIMRQLSNDMAISKKQGAIGWYTAGWMNRKEMFSHIVKLLYGQYIASLKTAQH